MNDSSWLEATFCSGGDHLWSVDDLWNTAAPVFSRCLLKTVPVWVPAALLTLCAPLQTALLWSWHRSHRAYPIALNAYNVGRMVVVGLLIAVSLVHLGYDYIVALDYDHKEVKESRHNLTADLSSSLVNAFIFSLFLFLINLHRLTGQHTSALTFYFTAALLVATIPTVYMLSMFFWRKDTYTQQFNSPAEAVILLAEVVLKLLLFLYTCFADTARLAQDIDEEETEDERGPSLDPYPESGVSFLSKHTYWWFNGLARLGYSKALKAEDVWDNQPHFKARKLAARFERHWQMQTDKIRSQTPAGGSINPPGVLSVLISTFGFTYFRACLFQLVSLVLIFTAPQLLKQTIAFISEKDAPVWHGYLLATALFSTYAVNSLVFVYFIRRICAIGNAVKNSLVTAIYRKALRLSSAARRQATTGQIVNLMSTDARQFNNMIMALDDVFVAPMQISLSTFFLWRELGASALAGIGAMIALLPINWWFTRVEQRAVKRQKAIMDERVNLTSETLAGIKVIKLYGWEGAFIEKISAVRLKETTQLRIISLFNALTSFTWNLAPFLVAFSTFAVYVLSSSEHVLDAKKAFICLTLFTMLQYPLGALPQVINKMVETATSIQRLNRFFAAEELEDYIQKVEEETDDQVDVRMEKATLSWGESEAAVLLDDDDDKNKKKKKEKEQKRKTSSSSDESSSASSSASSSQPPLNLTSIDLRIGRGSLVAIVGKVGAGKSSLLSAILGEMQLTSGRVRIAADRAISYVAQQAWIQNATLRDNILFGGPYDEGRYKAVLKMCALGPDLAILPAGDQTEIGEKGINLSGGQKQRVALARACYAPGDIFLFDDPLSAVDSHVAKHLFTHVLSSETGFLCEKTRIIATNNVSILSDVDQIVVLTKGAVSEVGTYEQLMATEGGAFAAFMREHAKQAVVEEDGDGGEMKTDKEKKKVEMERQISQKATEKDVLIEEEKAEEGDVKMSVYLNYFKSLKVVWLVVIGLSWLTMQVAYVGTDLWLAIWSSDAVADGNSTASNSSSSSTSLRNERLAIYGVLGFSHNILFFIGWIALALGSAASSVTLHRQLLLRIMRSPMAFFDTTPLGRIINRFSKDMSTIDSNIRFALEGWVICLLQVFSLIIMIIIQIPLLAVVVLIVAILYYMIQRYYIATYRQLSRLESVTSSPIFSHFAESLSGMATIRAFNHQRRFIRTSNRHVDLNQRVWWAMIAANRWMSVRMELCGNLIVLFAALLGVAARASFAGRPGYFGLIISYAMGVTGSLKWLVRNAVQMETSIVSVERIGEYSELPMEAEWSRPINAQPRLPENWPTEGAIGLENLSIRYRAGLEPVLKGISLQIKAGEKVGVIGRTGAGKSTITLALFRILEASAEGFDGGSITIDGVDISQIGLHELRCRLAIIPQDPVLFSGTIRSNLDPLGTSAADSATEEDSVLWTALERCHLKEMVAALAGGLDATVAEGGSNLSQGERQLLCLGRALIRRAKILVLDEATAAVDLATDALVQETIRREFAHCTVLTIAHRLHTVLNYDRILALHEGRVVEFDSPEALLADSSSLFYSLAKDAGLV